VPEVPVTADVLPLRQEARRLSPAEVKAMPAPRWLLRPFIPEGLTLLSGASGQGKSFLALRWAFTAATEGHRVLYVAAEDIQQFGPRYDALEKATGASPEGFEFWPEMPVLDGAAAYMDLGADLADSPVDLLVIDTLSAAAGPYDEVDPAAALELKDRCLSFMATEGAKAVLVVAHHGWNTGRVIGSSAIVRQFRVTWDLLDQHPDQTIRLEPGLDQANVVWLKCSKNRLGPREDPTGWQFKRPRGSTAPVLDPLPDGAAVSSADRLRQVLHLRGDWMTRAELEEATGMPTSTVKRLTKTVGAEVDTAGKTHRYRLLGEL
jgi:hypothetical protein